MIRSAVALNNVDPGFDPRGVTIAHVSLPTAGYETPEQVSRAFARIAERLEQAPGAAAAGLASAAPFEGGNDNGLVPEGRPLDIRSAIQSDFRLVTPGYFRAMGIRLRRGRTFTADDRAGAMRVMVVNETMAREAWPGEDPIGKRMACCEGGERRPEVEDGRRGRDRCPGARPGPGPPAGVLSADGDRRPPQRGSGSAA